MSNFIGRPPFSNSLWVGIETMQFHIAQTKFFLRTPLFPIQGVPMNNLAPMKNCPGGGARYPKLDAGVICLDLWIENKNNLMLKR